MESRIDNAFTNYLGIDPKKDLKQATREVTDYQEKALDDLAKEDGFNDDGEPIEKCQARDGQT